MIDKTDMLFGRIAVVAGFCSREEVEHCIREQELETENGGRTNLGEIMIKSGILDFDQVNEVLKAQTFTENQNNDRMLGHLAVKNGFVREDDVRECLVEQDRLFDQGKTVPRLGEMLIAAGKLTRQQMNALLQSQERLTRTG